MISAEDVDALRFFGVTVPAWSSACLTAVADGSTVAAWCRQSGISRREVSAWLVGSPEFAAAFGAAQEAGARMMLDDSLDIADTQLRARRLKIDAQGRREVVYEDALGHRKLQVSTRIKLAEKLSEKLAPRQRVALGGDPDAPPVELSETERVARVQGLLALAEERARAAGEVVE